MDNLGPGLARGPTLGYGPDRRIAAATAAAALVFTGLGLTAVDAPGRLLYLLAAVVLGGSSAGDLLVNPRLVVGPAGLSVRSARSRSVVPWAEVDDVRVDERARFGLAGRTLEIDAGERLFVLSGRVLGTDARTVAGVIAAFRAPPAPGSARRR